MTDTYRVVIRLPIDVRAMGPIADAFPGAMVLTQHDEGDGVMVLDVPCGEVRDDD